MKIWPRRILGVLGIGGGAVGFVACVTKLLGATQLVHWAIYVVFGSLYAWGAWCGVKLMESQPNALRYNRRFWLIQIPALNSPLLGYSLASGFHLTLSLSLTPFNLGFSCQVGSAFNFSLLQWDQPLSLGVNVVAYGIYLWLAHGFPDVPVTAVQSPA
jgi:hypothetical protein